jgi:hypothetical protein
MRGVPDAVKILLVASVNVRLAEPGEEAVSRNPGGPSPIQSGSASSWPWTSTPRRRHALPGSGASRMSGASPPANSTTTSAWATTTWIPLALIKSLSSNGSKRQGKIHGTGTLAPGPSRPTHPPTSYPPSRPTPGQTASERRASRVDSMQVGSGATSKNPRRRK